MSTVVDRDGTMQVKFGEYIIEFAESMKELCTTAKGHIDEARDNVKDDAPAAAMDNMEQLINAILSALPATEEFGEHQKTQGKIIIEAEEYKFKKT